MQIGIIGAGKVGRTLGQRFSDVGHDIHFGVRTPTDEKHADAPGAVVEIAAAVRAAEVVILTTPWSGAEDALRAAGDLQGKVVVDATNPIGAGGVLAIGRDDSGAEQVARWAPEARVVKAFNTIGREVMERAQFDEARAVLWLCGDDEPACATVASLASAIGFEPVRLGPLSRARVIEPAALLWISSASALGTRQFAWGVLRR